MASVVQLAASFEDCWRRLATQLISGRTAQNSLILLQAIDVWCHCSQICGVRVQRRITQSLSKLRALPRMRVERRVFVIPINAFLLAARSVLGWITHRRFGVILSLIFFDVATQRRRKGFPLVIG